ncbi:MAG: S-layer homology domain-containing protein [Defluviitaleaceae bacterium]|nr:S-layer homology domain-containing protein [Defluviitaleaceae bacterium]
MATEQAAYALVAYWRFVNNMSSLYDMGNAGGTATQEPAATPVVTPAVTPIVTPVVEPDVEPEPFGLPGRHDDIRRIGIASQNRTFGDIQNYANRSAIEALAARDIIAGRSENAFAPTDTMTRAEFATIITRGLGLPDRPNNAQFTDVPADAWFAGPVGIAFYYEIISGTSPSTFNPNGTITRQEAAAMVARAARLSGMDINLGETETLNILATFGDYRLAGDWAWPALAFCYREGILDDSGFYIEPMSAITRGQIADMLYRLMGRADLL